MNTNIFNAIKHNGHDLRLIEKDGVILLGCVSCGETLYSYEKAELINIHTYHELEDIEELVKAYDICMQENANHTARMLKELIIAAFDFKERAIKLLSQEMPDGYCHQILLSKKSWVVELLEHLGESAYDLFKNEIQKLINEGELICAVDKQILEIGKHFVLSNEIIRPNEYAHNYNITIIDLKRAAELELENPTVKDTIKVDSVANFYGIKPGYEEEEEEDPMFKEFVFRMKNDLIDFSNLTIDDKKRILKNSLEYFFEFEFTERHKYIIVKLLKELGLELDIK